VQVIETRKRVFGEAHPDTLSAMSSLVCVSRSQYRDEASGTAEQATSRRPCSPDKDRQHSTSLAPNTKDERDEEVVKPT